MVSPESHVSSTMRTRRPATIRGGPAMTTGRAPVSCRVMATDAKSRCRMLATTAPGITPALAMPITTSGSYSRKIFKASARHSSPKNGQSTWSTPCGVLRANPVLLGAGGRGGGGGGGGGGAGMGGEATLRTRAAASYFRPMGFWRRLLGGSGADAVQPQRLDYLNEALALARPSPDRPRRREMDRARHPGAPRPGRVRAHAGRHRGGALRGSRAGVLLLALATAAACGQLGPALDQVVALSVAVRDSIEELD